MIGEDVIREARAWLEWHDCGRFTPATATEKRAAGLLRLLADACEQENARRKLLAAAAEPNRTFMDWVRSQAQPGYMLPDVSREHLAWLLGHINRLEALLSDAEDTLRARAEGRKDGLLEAAAMCKSWGMIHTERKIREHAESLAKEGP